MPLIISTRRFIMMLPPSQVADASTRVHEPSSYGLHPLIIATSMSSVRGKYNCSRFITAWQNENWEHCFSNNNCFIYQLPGSPYPLDIGIIVVAIMTHVVVVVLINRSTLPDSLSSWQCFWWWLESIELKKVSDQAIICCRNTSHYNIWIHLNSSEIHLSRIRSRSAIGIHTQVSSRFTPGPHERLLNHRDDEQFISPTPQYTVKGSYLWQWNKGTFNTICT